jgi:hypothetical protein
MGDMLLFDGGGRGSLRFGAASGFCGGFRSEDGSLAGVRRGTSLFDADERLRRSGDG